MRLWFVFPLLGALFVLTARPAAHAAEANPPSSAVLIVHHAGCVICAPLIQSLLSHTPGVEEVAVSQANGDADVIARVRYDGGVTDPARLTARLAAQGYPAEVAPAPLNGR
jgi:mercuric ion binding protein